MNTPYWLLPDMTLPAPATVPPIVLLLLRMSTPAVIAVGPGAVAEFVHADQVVGDGVAGTEQETPEGCCRRSGCDRRWPGCRSGRPWTGVDQDPGAVLACRRRAQHRDADEVAEHLDIAGTRLGPDADTAEPIER